MSFEDMKMPSPREFFIREIEGRIIKGKLEIGEKLPTERQLAEQTGIKQSVVHAAIRDLENLGFVRIVPRHGVYVADYLRTGSFETLNEILRYNGGKLSLKMSLDLVELRNAIEGGALIKLAECHSDNDIKLLRESLAELEAAKDKNLSMQALGLMTSKFHYLVCELSGNDLFPLMMNSFGHLSIIIWENCAAFWGIDAFLEQDAHLIDLIERGQGYEAQKYISDIFKQFVEAFMANPHILDNVR